MSEVINKNGASWQVMLMAAALIISVGSGLFTLLNPRDDIKQVKSDLSDEIRKNDREIAEMRQLFRETISDILKATVTIREYTEFKDREVIRQTEDEKQLHDLEEKVVTQREHADLKGRVEGLQLHYVPREEHIEHWTQFTERLNAVTAAVDTLRKEALGQFTVGDNLKQIQHEVDDLRSFLVTSAPKIAIPLSQPSQH